MKRSRMNLTYWGWLLYPEPRHLVVVVCFLATLTAYVERTGFSIAYTLMAEDIDQSTKGMVMSAFYWGYGISQIPGGVAAQKYGGTRVLSLCFCLWSLASILTPGNPSNISSLLISRFVVGVSQGFLIPAVHTVVSLWIPAGERAKGVSLITSGMYLGSAAAMEILPMISSRYGPSFILKLNGMLGFGWLVIFRMVMRHVESQSVSTTSLPLSTSQIQQKRMQKSSQRITPWRRMIVHPAVWSIVVNNFTFHYAFYIVMNWLPTYFDKVLHVSIESVGFAKTLPYISMFLASNAGGWSGDYLIAKGGMSVASGRKWVNTCGFICSGIALCMMPGARTVTSGIVYTTSALAAAGFARGGFSVNHMDIAPAFAGVVMGISNTAGTLAGVIGVAVTGYILSCFDGGTATTGWYAAFSLAAGLCFSGSALFMRYARGSRLFGDESSM
jgi:ACS family sodium-dependent inorganic phosphate cotransporter